MRQIGYNIALAASNILFGISFSAYVSLLRGATTPSMLFALQLLFSAIIFAPFALRRHNIGQLSLNDFGTIFIVALLVIFGWWYLLIEGAHHTNPVDASTIATIGPIFTLVVATIADTRHTSRGEIAGILTAIAGALVLLIDRGASLLSNRGEGYGNTLVLCATFASATNTLLITPVLRHHNAAMVMGWYYIIGSLLASPLIAHELRNIDTLHLTPVEWCEVGYILLLGSALPTLLLYVGSKHLTPIHTALYRYLQPIVATIVAVARNQTKIDRTNIVGAALIFVGMLCVILFAPQRSNDSPTRG
jgi:drug/metabolite transporter (DMT)-like permease